MRLNRRAFAVLACVGLSSGTAHAQEEGWSSTTLQWFSDASFGWEQGGEPGLSVGILDLFLNSTLENNFFALGEVVIASGGGAAGALGGHFHGDKDAGGSITLARLEVGWAPRRDFRVAIGRRHTPLGYWNQTFHHGKWTTPSIIEPLFLSYPDEDALLPTHAVGIEVSGEMDTGGATLGYKVAADNGRGTTLADAQNLGDENAFKALGLELSASVSGVRVFVGGRLDQFNLEGVADKVREIIAVGGVTYEGERLEVMVEGLLVHREAGDVKPNHLGGYLHLGYRLGEAWKPYLRGDYIKIDQEAIATHGADAMLGAAGLRWDATSQVAIKIEGGLVLTDDHGAAAHTDEHGAEGTDHAEHALTNEEPAAFRESTIFVGTQVALTF